MQVIFYMITNRSLKIMR